MHLSLSPQIAVNPRDQGRKPAQKTTGLLHCKSSYIAVQNFSAVYLYSDVELIFNCTDNNPSTDNIAYSCSSTLNRSSISYDLTFSLHLDETFTPAVISAISNLRAASFQVNSNGDVIVAGVTIRHIPLDSNVTQGPVTIEIPYDNFAQRLNGIGYSLAVCICNA